MQRGIETTRACGDDARVASEATSAFKEALAHVPDVMLLDIELPVVSGLELLSGFARSRR